MEERFLRTKMLIGENAINKLMQSRIAVFGVGGVGSFVVEGLVRAGIGSIDIFDNDKISITNINRQIIALTQNIGKYKVEVMKERILNINPKVNVMAYNCFYSKDVSELYDFKKYDYIIDAIDTVSSKIDIIQRAKNEEINIISCMGTGNKLNPSRFKICDIYKTSVCPLARVIRKELKERNIKSLKVLYSDELPVKVNQEYQKDLVEESQNSGSSRRSIPGSISFVPSVAGLMISSEVIKDLIGL